MQIETNNTTIGPFATDAEYITFVVSNAALSYQNQYSAATPEDGITAAREAYNTTVQPTVEVV